MFRRFEYDREADAIYINLIDKPFAYTKKVDNRRHVDYASDDTPIGIELLCVSDGIISDGIPILEEVLKDLSKRHIKVHA
ncbi:MAG: DUF2283 domain-containing protein [Chloroflexi bacterium]|nr:DUF2283 domain-containing protein [Chloroflexota bacterium]